MNKELLIINAIFILLMIAGIQRDHTRDRIEILEEQVAKPDTVFVVVEPDTSLVTLPDSPSW